MNEGFDYTALPQAMVYPDNHCNPSLRGRPKGLKKSLRNMVFLILGVVRSCGVFSPGTAVPNQRLID